MSRAAPDACHPTLQKLLTAAVVVGLLRRRRAAGLQHFLRSSGLAVEGDNFVRYLEQLVPHPADGVVLRQGEVGEHVVVAEVRGEGVPVLAAEVSGSQSESDDTYLAAHSNLEVSLCPVPTNLFCTCSQDLLKEKRSAAMPSERLPS